MPSSPAQPPHGEVSVVVGYLGYSPAGMERLRALVADASERCAIFARGIDAVRLPDGVIAPDVGVLTRLRHTLDTHFYSAIETILASDAMTATAPIPDELIDLAARRGITHVDVATLDDRLLLERLRAVIWVHTATGGNHAPTVFDAVHAVLDEVRHRPGVAAQVATMGHVMSTLLTTERLDRSTVDDALAAVYAATLGDQRLDLAAMVVRTAALDRLSPAGLEFAIHTTLPLLNASSSTLDRSVITVPLDGVDATTVLGSRADVVNFLGQLLDDDRGRTAVGVTVGDITNSRLRAAMDADVDGLDPIDVIGARLAPVADLVGMIAEAARQQAHLTGVQAAAAVAGTRQGLGYLAALTTASHPIPAIAVRALPLALDPVVALVANVDTAPAAAAAAIATATTVSIVRILVDRPEVRARVGLAAVPTARWTSLADALKRADAADDVDQRDRALADVDRVIDNDLHLSTYVARVTTTASLTWG